VDVGWDLIAVDDSLCFAGSRQIAAALDALVALGAARDRADNPLLDRQIADVEPQGIRCWVHTEDFADDVFTPAEIAETLSVWDAADRDRRTQAASAGNVSLEILEAFIGFLRAAAAHGGVKPA
jgi:hypothetical protein